MRTPYIVFVPPEDVYIQDMNAAVPSPGLFYILGIQQLGTRRRGPCAPRADRTGIRHEVLKGKQRKSRQNQLFLQIFLINLEADADRATAGTLAEQSHTRLMGLALKPCTLVPQGQSAYPHRRWYLEPTAKILSKTIGQKLNLGLYLSISAMPRIDNVLVTADSHRVSRPCSAAALRKGALRVPARPRPYSTRRANGAGAGAATLFIRYSYHDCSYVAVNIHSSSHKNWCWRVSDPCALLFIRLARSIDTITFERSNRYADFIINFWFSCVGTTHPAEFTNANGLLVLNHNIVDFHSSTYKTSIKSKPDYESC
ncbi:hypothetical protein EVAR_54857_1 [Eumeta japonica]|uniref:Uncharacterized protein n=1 Tax=Eumeta variegata TaxID=151549 RepID=A0A4C1YHI7_EUMVA|nr:hypothetical protein EVAR_54857_1 [Eumeta japonica]